MVPSRLHKQSQVTSVAIQTSEIFQKCVPLKLQMLKQESLFIHA